MYLLSAVTTKQQALGVTDWSSGSPSCRLFLPAAVAEKNPRRQNPHVMCIKGDKHLNFARKIEMNMETPISKEEQFIR